MMAVIKADAYGHGAVRAAAAFSRAGADWFGVSNLDEAVELRTAGFAQPILVISYTPAAQVSRLAEHSITQTVVSLQHAKELSEAAVDAGVQLRVHLKLDTGMSRVGFACHNTAQIVQSAEILAEVCALPGLHCEGIFTHFASADETDGESFTQQQFERFMAVIKAVEKLGVHFTLRHCCNSAAALRFPHMHLDMIRAGIVLYGLMPDREMSKLIDGIRPAMELKTTVSMVKELPASVSLSYGRTYTTEKKIRVATVPIGYADGYSRLLSGRICMLVHGKHAPQIGRICMDQCMLDVSTIPAVTEGTVVTVFGEDGDSFLPVEALAEQIGTIHYELICMVSRRVPRVYYDGDKPVGVINYVVKE